MIESRGVRILLRLATACVLAFLYLPIASSSRSTPSTRAALQAWPPTGFTLHWFGEALANPAVLEAVGNSLLVGVGGDRSSRSCSGRSRRSPSSATRSSAGRPISFFLVLPIALPGVVTGHRAAARRS